MNSKQAYTAKQDMLKTHFQKDYETWNNEDCMDDRVIFCNLYRILMEACEVMKKIENNTIRCAFNDKFKKDFITMDEIADTFRCIEE